MGKQHQAAKSASAKSAAARVEVKEQRWWKWVFIGLSAAIFLALPLMSLDAGNSGDEDSWQYPHSESLYKYYTTLGRDTSYISNGLELAYSGYAFDAATMFVIKAFNADDYMAVRHVMNALMGALLMLFVGLLARLIGGWRAGCIALLLIFFSPQILGQSFNNPKDIPFAAFLMGAVYYIAWFIKEFPNPSWKTCVKLGVMIGATIGIRPGGFLLLPYFGLFVMAYYMMVNKPKEYFSAANQLVLKQVLIRVLAVLGVMLVVMFILWPYALKNPGNIVSSFKRASKFESILRQLYEGKMVWSDQLPWYYTLKYIFITSPLAVFAGVAAYLFTCRKFEKGYFWLFVLLFCFAFPIFWVAYSEANIYGGWRHSLFAYPTLAVAAGLGFNSLILLFSKNKYLHIALTALPLVLLVNPIAFAVKNHPYEYVYFNKLAGGVKGAYGNYEMDYYYHSTREASEWIIADVRKNGAPDSTRKTRVVTWHLPSVSYFFRKDTADFSVGFSRWYQRGYNDWDYAVFTITGVNPELLKNKKAFPPKNTAYQVKVNNVPVCLVLKREDRCDFLGHRAMQSNAGSAIPLLRKALVYDEYNEQALEDLITVYQQVNMLDSALVLAQRWVAFNKGSTTALNQLASVYLAKGDYSSAIVTANAIIKYNSRDISGLWIAANAQAQQGQMNDALRTLQRLLKIRGDFRPAYQLMAQIYDRAGDRQRAQQILNAIN